MPFLEVRSATHADIGRDELVDLYASVGWTAYTRTPDLLLSGLAGSTHIAVARLDDRLVGLARVISDSATIAYLQDVLVHPDHQRLGLGRALVDAVLEPVRQVRQQVLLTDDEPGTRAFYESLGWRDIADGSEPRLRAFIRR